MLPGDEEERMFYVIDEMSWAATNKEFESTTLTGVADVDGAAAMHLVTDGPFAPTSASIPGTAS